MSYELKSARYLAREVLERAVGPGDAVIPTLPVTQQK